MLQTLICAFSAVFLTLTDYSQLAETKGDGGGLEVHALLKHYAG